MAEPTAATSPAKKGGLLKSLSPKQKRYAAVLGAGGLLALLYMLYRGRSEGTTEQTPSDSTVATESAVPASATGGGENGSAFTGAESETLAERLSEVGAGLSSTQTGLSELGAGEGTLAENQSALGTSMGEGFSSLATSQEQAQKNTAAALNKNSRSLSLISKQLKNKANKQKPNSGKAGSKHTTPASKKAAQKAPPKKKAPAKKAPAKKNTKKK